MADSAALINALAEMVQAKMKESSGPGSWQAGWKHDSPSGSPSSPYYTGPGGLFGVDGLERDLISTRIQPRGLASVLPAVGTNRMNPLYGYITGFLDVSGTVANGVCDDPQTAGPGKSCIQTAQFGRYSFQSRELEINRLGQQIDRGEFQDLRIINDPLLETLGTMVNPDVPGGPMLGREVLMRFMEMGISFQNALIPQVYTGNPANNSAGGGYAEFPGLDILIGTNKVDALTGTNCPSLDSDIKNFNYAKVDSVSSNADIVNVLSYLMRYLRHNAEGMGLTPVRWVMTMRRALFWELTAVWPCSYLTYRCIMRSADNNMLNVDANDAVAMRDAMRSGSYLVMDGERFDVIIDDGIVEETESQIAAIDPGCFASDIYIIPMTVMGGMVVTNWEYFDYSQGPMTGIADGRLTDQYWTDGGRYLWHKKPPVNWCVQWLAKIEPRLILRTPQLAGRITNVQYCPLQHERQPFPDDPYFVNGGVSTARSGPSLYSDWNLPA